MNGKTFFVKSLTSFVYTRAVCVDYTGRGTKVHVLYSHETNKVIGVGTCDGSCEAPAQVVFGRDDALEVLEHLQNNP